MTQYCRLDRMRLEPIIVAVASLIAANAWAANQAALPKCDIRIKLMNVEPADVERMHMPSGRVLVEFAIDALGHVSGARVVKSSDKRLDEPSRKSVLLWRFVAPPTQCRHQMSITYRGEDRQVASPFVRGSFAALDCSMGIAQISPLLQHDFSDEQGNEQAHPQQCRRSLLQGS